MKARTLPRLTLFAMLLVVSTKIYHPLLHPFTKLRVGLNLSTDATFHQMGTLNFPQVLL